MLEAILDFRMVPLNARRTEMLGELESEGRESDVVALVEIIVLPFAEHLLESSEDSYYISLLSQLYSQQRAEPLLRRATARTNALRVLGEHVIRALEDVPAEIAATRMRWVGAQVVHVVAEWDHQRRADPATFTPAHVRRSTSDLVDYLVGGLRAPARRRK
jgi:hypothetical protein